MQSVAAAHGQELISGIGDALVMLQEAARARRWGQSSYQQQFAAGHRNAAGGRR